jgi:hypothetical protein
MGSKMRRQFNPTITINSWRVSMKWNEDHNGPFALWFKSKMNELSFQRRDLIQYGIVSGELTKLLKCKRYPHPHNVAKVVTAICIHTNSNVNTMLSECLNQIGFYK